MQHNSFISHFPFPFRTYTCYWYVKYHIQSTQVIGRSHSWSFFVRSFMQQLHPIFMKFPLNSTFPTFHSSEFRKESELRGPNWTTVLTFQTFRAVTCIPDVESKHVRTKATNTRVSIQTLNGLDKVKKKHTKHKHTPFQANISWHRPTPGG